MPTDTARPGDLLAALTWRKDDSNSIFWLLQYSVLDQSLEPRLTREHKNSEAVPKRRYATIREPTASTGRIVTEQ